VAEFITDYEAADTLVFNGFGHTGVNSLSFFNSGNGDLVLQLTDTQFVIFEGISEQSELSGAFEFG